MRDYLEHRLSPMEERHRNDTENLHISFHNFRNKAAFSSTKDLVHIIVDGDYEEIVLQDIFSVLDKIVEWKYPSKPDSAALPEFLQEMEQEATARNETEHAVNAEQFALLCEKFRIDRTVYDDFVEREYTIQGISKQTPLYNILSGADISLRYGEGLVAVGPVKRAAK